ncbi:MAG: NUDIX hydrolase, partial [Chlamydiota bacterium]
RDEAGNIYFVKQHRPSIQKDLLEIPAGIMEKGEEAITCAQRELQEEIGFMAKRWIPLGNFYTSPGFCNEYVHLFLAFDLKKSILKPDDDESIEVVKIPEDKVRHMLLDGTFEDLKTALGIFYFLEWQKHKEAIWPQKKHLFFS